ncbi:MAG: hypothetical protein Q9163_000166 [Psora crenata]
MVPRQVMTGVYAGGDYFQNMNVLGPDTDLGDVCLQVGRLTVTDRISGVLRSDIIDAALSLGQQHSADPSARAEGPYKEPISAWFKPCPLLPLTRFFDNGPIGTLHTSALPTWNEWQLLCDQYFIAVDPVAHLLSRKAFERTAKCLYEDIWYGAPARDSTEALLLSVSFAAVVSLPSTECQLTLGTTKTTLVERYKSATEAQLHRAKILKTSNLETIQAALPMCRGEISRSCSVFVGALIRNAQIAGIDAKDGPVGGSLLADHFRRHLWCQICFLDLRTAEARGPKPVIPVQEHEAALPINISDEKISIAPPPSGTGESCWTDSTFSLIRYECYEIHRWIFRGRQDITEGRATLDMIADVITKRKLRIETLYLRNLDDSAPLQRCAKLVGQLLIARMVKSTLRTVELGATLENDPDLAPWAWYAETYQQHQDIIFLLIEAQRFPYLEEADRIHIILDYVFGRFFGAPIWQRSRGILRLIKRRLEILLDNGDMTRKHSELTQTNTLKARVMSETISENPDRFANDDAFWNECYTRLMLPHLQYEGLGKGDRVY